MEKKAANSDGGWGGATRLAVQAAFLGRGAKLERKSSTWRGRERSSRARPPRWASSAAMRARIWGRRAMMSVSSSGSTAAMIAGQTMLTTFQAMECHIVVSFLLRAEKRRSAGRHPMHEQREQELCVEPRQDRVVAVVGEPIEVAERLPSLEGQFRLPPQAIQGEAHLGG